MKPFVICIWLFNCLSVSAQENKIAELLNIQLTKEISAFEKYDSLKVIQPYTVTGEKKLVFEYEKYDANTKRWEVIKQEVSLREISGIGKDINILFLTDGYKVLVTKKTYTSNRELIRTDITDNNMFFTQLFEEKKNEQFRDALIKAFKNAGYTITPVFWYD